MNRTVTPPVTDQPPRCLRWTVRASFLRYVAGLPDGRASATDGARITQSDPQEFVYVTDPEHSSDDVLAFRGDVRLSGHRGLLFVRVANPRIHLDGVQARLTVDDPMTEDGTGPRLTLVSLAIEKRRDDWWGTDVRLTADGVAFFNSVYPADEPFDPLSVTELTERGPAGLGQ